MPTNTSGLCPTAYRVLLKKEVVGEKTSGGVYLPEQSREKEIWLKQRAEIVEMGPTAFENRETFGQCRPIPGQRCFIDRYAGYMVRGDDGTDYVLCNDTDVLAIIQSNEIQGGAA